LVLSLNACADTAAIRENKRARYDNLETELINEQKAKDQRLRNQYRSKETTEPVDTEETVATGPGATTNNGASSNIIVAKTGKSPTIM